MENLQPCWGISLIFTAYFLKISLNSLKLSTEIEKTCQTAYKSEIGRKQVSFFTRNHLSRRRKPLISTISDMHFKQTSLYFLPEVQISIA